MDISEFQQSLQDDSPPSEVGPELNALWQDAKGNWDVAHKIAQEISNDYGSWVHAYLHRKKGDDANASYWYSRAGRCMPALTVEGEWTDIVKTLLQ